MLGKCLENVKNQKPLVHCITNYVTVNDVANSIIACGASPIMSDEPKDVADITAICGSLYINIGTLNRSSIEAMLVAGKKASDNGKLILLDPVGAGASSLRTTTALEILKQTTVGIIRGNISEIKALASGSGTTRGVDADTADEITPENLSAMIDFAKKLSEQSKAVIAITGKIDLVADSRKCYVIYNGCAQMSQITGTGCMLSGIASAYAAANPQNITEAVAAAVCVMGIAGEQGLERMEKCDGNSSLRNYIIDAVYNMTGEVLERRAKYEVR